MKAVTLTQPWATLVAQGAKRIETRSWYTGYRGPLAIHAAKSFPREARLVSMEPAFTLALKGPGGYGVPLPLGRVVATCVLEDCVRIVSRRPKADRALGESGHEAHTDVRIERTTAGELIYCDGATGIHVDAELPFGDYTPGRWAWILMDVKRLPTPIAARGALGLWDWERGGEDA